MKVETPNGTSVHIQRTLAASPSRVFDAFTDPDRMAAWMWGSISADVTAQADVRIGGRYSVATDAKAGQESEWHHTRWAMTGVYAVVEPAERLVYTIHWDGPVGYNAGDANVADEVVVVEFTAVDGGTDLEFWHLGIPDDGVSARTHAEGIADTFEHLAALVEA